MTSKTIIGTCYGKEVSLDDDGNMVYASTGDAVLTGSTSSNPMWVYQGSGTSISATNVVTTYPYSYGTTSGTYNSYIQKTELNNKFILIKKEKGIWQAYKALFLISSFDHSVSYQDSSGELKNVRLDKCAILGDQDLINKSIEKGITIIESWPKELLTADEEDMRDIIE